MRRNALLIIITLLCVCARAERTEVHVAEPGSLSTILTQEQKDTCTQLVVKGKLNSADIQLLRQMGGYTDKKDGKVGKLMYIDLSDTEFVTDKEPYLVMNATEEHMFVTKPMISERSTEIPHTTTPHPFDMHMHHSIGGNGYSTTTYDGVWSLGGKSYFTLNDLDRKDTRPSDKRYYFGTERISNKHWRFIRRINRHTPKGHKLKRDKDGRVNWMSYTTEGVFCQDMFYKCPNVMVVIIPRNVKTSNRVGIKNDSIRYFKS